MNSNFEIIFLEEAIDFLDNLDNKAREKIIYNIDKARFVKDPKLFKKLTDFIWEFRTKYDKKNYRLLAFWDKDDINETLVISTHGFVKKSSKVKKKEIRQAEKIRIDYFEGKS